jgi:hypothetical protein
MVSHIWLLPAFITLVVLVRTLRGKQEHPLGYGGIGVMSRGMSGAILLFLSWALYLAIVVGQ